MIDRVFEENQMVKEISGKEFQESGMLWLVNSFLHTYGMAITIDTETGEIKPAIVRFRGFSQNVNDVGYKRLTQYMIENAEELIKDCD